MTQVAITGASGLIGSALAAALRADGHRVRPVVRGSRRAASADKAAIWWDPAAGAIDAEALDGIDAVVHLAGRSIGEHRWSGAEKEALLSSRTASTELLSSTLAERADSPRVLISASAIGIYGDRGDEELTEDSAPGSGFLAELCRQWEGATAVAEDAGVRVVHIRTGLVLSGDGGFLDRPVRLFRVGLGGRLGTGRQWWSWISIHDEVAAIRFLLDHEMTGPFNLTGPAPLTNAEFTKALGRVLHRPTILPAPGFAIRRLLGRELANEVVLAGQRVLPRRLLDAGFEFRYAEAEAALAAALG